MRGENKQGAGEGKHRGRVHQPLAPPDDRGPGAERKIMIILILLVLCAVLGVAAGVMVVVSRNASGGATPTPGAGMPAPILALVL